MLGGGAGVIHNLNFSAEVEMKETGNDKRMSVNMESRNIYLKYLSL